MLTPEERRQRILENSQSRLAKLRDANQSTGQSITPPMAPVSSLAPTQLLQKSSEEPLLSSSLPNAQQQSSSSWFSTIASATNLMNSFTSASTKIEVTEETILLDKQHMLMAILGILVGLLYSFYISSQSKFFSLVLFTSCVCILTSRYHVMQMKQRSNALITTAMLSGFQPEVMKKLLLVYTLLRDAWVIFAFYFVAFCLTHVLCSLF